MALKKRKGFSIETKTLRFKLLRNGIDLQETKDAFNELVEFFFIIINTHPEGLDVKDDEPWHFYESLTIGSPTQYVSPLPDAPADFRRAAIRLAMGAYSSWRSNFERWKERPKRHRHHRPPVQPRCFNFNPTFNSSIHKDDDGKSIMLKIRRNNNWVWVKFEYLGYDLPKEENWVKASPTVVLKDNGAWLNFAVQRYVTATGGIKKVIESSNLRICSIDIDLDQNIAICSILESDDNGEVREIARYFVPGYSVHVSRRKLRLGLIAVAMNKTGIIHKGFAAKTWEKIHNGEINEGDRVSAEIVNFAQRHEAKIIVFEHLQNLKPDAKKYSARSNLKRAYWLKSKIFNNVRRIAYQRHSILTARVNPKDTSRYCAFDGEPVCRPPKNLYSDSMIRLLKALGVWGNFKEPLFYQTGARLYQTDTNYKGHSGLNAARRVGLKFLQRKFQSPTLVKVGSGKLQANSSTS